MTLPYDPRLVTQWFIENGLVLKEKIDLVPCGDDPDAIKICNVVGKLPEPPPGIVKVKITQIQLPIGNKE